MTIRTKRARSPRGSGDLLADEIIAAATSLVLRESDPMAISIRSVAAKVGVSPPAIYLHFADKNELLNAVCGRYFERLDDALAPAEAISDDSLEQLLALGKAYVKFGLASPVLYKMAFTNSGRDGQWTRVDELLASTAFVRMGRVVGRLADEGFFDVEPDDRPKLALELWSIAHGLVDLIVSKPGLPWGDDLEFAEDVLRASAVGLAVGATSGNRASMVDLRRWVTTARAAPGGGEQAR